MSRNETSSQRKFQPSEIFPDNTKGSEVKQKNQNENQNNDKKPYEFQNKQPNTQQPSIIRLSKKEIQNRYKIKIVDLEKIETITNLAADYSPLFVVQKIPPQQDYKDQKKLTPEIVYYSKKPNNSGSSKPSGSYSSYNHDKNNSRPNQFYDQEDNQVPEWYDIDDQVLLTGENLFQQLDKTKIKEGIEKKNSNSNQNHRGHNSNGNSNYPHYNNNNNNNNSNYQRNNNNNSNNNQNKIVTNNGIISRNTNYKPSVVAQKPQNNDVQTEEQKTPTPPKKQESTQEDIGEYEDIDSQLEDLYKQEMQNRQAGEDLYKQLEKQIVSTIDDIEKTQPEVTNPIVEPNPIKDSNSFVVPNSNGLPNVIPNPPLVVIVPSPFSKFTGFNQIYSDADVWFYIDRKNCLQGPFNSTQMDEWFDDQYFPHTLQICMAPTGQEIRKRENFMTIEQMNSFINNFSMQVRPVVQFHSQIPMNNNPPLINIIPQTNIYSYHQPHPQPQNNFRAHPHPHPQPQPQSQPQHNNQPQHKQYEISDNPDQYQNRNSNQVNNNSRFQNPPNINDQQQFPNL